MAERRMMYRNRIARAVQFVNSPDFEGSSATLLRSKLSLLTENWEKLMNEHAELVDLASTSEAVSSNEEYLDQAEDAFIKTKTALLDRIEELRLSSSQEPSNRNVREDSTGQSDLQLERVSIGTFNGEFSKWPEFRDIFKSMVHEKNYAAVTKLHLLKKALIGDAAKVLGNWQLLDANYEPAWERLQEVYNDEYKIIQSHLETLFKLPAMKTESFAAIRNLVDTTNEVVRSLRVLKVPVDSWDTILVFMIVKRLSAETKIAWEMSRELARLPTLADIFQFLERRAAGLSNLSSEQLQREPKFDSKSYGGAKPKLMTAPSSSQTASKPFTCFYCKKAGHAFRTCPEFLSLNLQQRLEKLKDLNVCQNCLKYGHAVDQCQGGPCWWCPGSQRHNSIVCPKNLARAQANLLETQPTPIKLSQIDDSPAEAVKVQYEILPEISNVIADNSSTTEFVPEPPASALLATARVRIQIKENSWHPVRALCDSGSQINLITEEVVQRFNLKKHQYYGSVYGLGSKKPVKSNGAVTLKLTSWFHSDYEITVQFIVVGKISSVMPNQQLKLSQYGRSAEFQPLNLADPNYETPNGIEALLGAEIWADILSSSIITQLGMPTAQATKIGWIMFGNCPGLELSSNNVFNNVHTISNNELNEELKKFWESEELIRAPYRSAEDQLCDEIFDSHHTRDDSGRYIVRIPFRSEIEGSLGFSRGAALKRFEFWESKRLRDQELRDEYNNFMRTYEELGHMKIVTTEPKADHYYLPHHAVRTASKFRIVFDGSCKSSSGNSVNDMQLTGRRLQDELTAIIWRFRTRQIALTADIVKMYRQVRIAEEHRDYQRIIWRYSPSEDLKEYQLLTVTYGMTSAPYCAVRALQQCATDHKNDFPLAAKCALTDFYVDDLISGADSVEEAVDLYEQMTYLMIKGGFELAKWCSNNLYVHRAIKRAETSIDEAVEMNEPEMKSVLGLCWLPFSDEFSFRLNEMASPAVVTKRAVVSKVAKLYDPTGYLAPVIIVAKCFIQELWQLNVDWDDEVPSAVLERWTAFEESLQMLPKIRIPRWLRTTKDSTIQLHGFCDASQKAFGAVIYVKVVGSDSRRSCRMLTAKTRVAPVKSVTIPRLELCGAELLGRLMTQVKQFCNYEAIETIFWSDSTVVLHWLKKLPNELKPFVAHRVASVQADTAGCQWRYVPSSENPADLASRGLTPAELLNCQLWWEGPKWLLQSECAWPKATSLVPDEKGNYEAEYRNPPSVLSAHAMIEEENDGFSRRARAELQSIKKEFRLNTLAVKQNSLIDKYPLPKLLRITAYALRFKNNIFARMLNADVKTGMLKRTEIAIAMRYWVKVDQQKSFPDELKILKDPESTTNIEGGPLQNLRPFLDAHGVLRITGRLSNSNLDYDLKYPIILSGKGRLAQLLIEDAHAWTLHGGLQDMTQFLRQQFWIVGARRAIKHCINKCMNCFRQRQETARQLMGDLPASRVTQFRAFARSGVDYGGPITLKAWAGRCKRTTKGYIALFVCMATRAVHLEAVTDLTTDAFLAAFRRFVSRRGTCIELNSDNATTFVGAAKELKAVWKSKDMTDELSAVGTNWNFITPAAPHQGGLWEAAIKSTKHHLYRLLGAHQFTFEELSTVLIQIEAVLNSRPLTALTEDATDFVALTPGHFLVGEPLILPPTQDLTLVPMNRLRRWKLMQRMLQDFWSRWSNEYLASLQRRVKWAEATRNIKIGDLVLIKTELRPPTHWSMARVIEVYPGADGRVRAVKLRTSRGELRRPIQKLCVLPFQTDEIDEE